MTPVPAQYLGVWQRRLLETPAARDTTSQVYWLQTSLWHADLRIPAKRPDFGRITRLDQCSDGQLAWLASQQSFAGITQVLDTRCTWQRHADYQPDNGCRDIGLMTFTGDRVIETGAEADYLEIWQHLPESRGECVALQLESEYGTTAQRPTWLLWAGAYFVYVRARPQPLPAADHFSQLIAKSQPSRSQLLDWLDFEISFGRRSGTTPWRIERSTLPFREGKRIVQPDGLQRLDSRTLFETEAGRRWRVLDESSVHV
ncbi:hypothetical protein SKTS_01900 [Sulfurimicrobium lacus]|uniref:Uncharacterized protein n=1 Tax=Sulfurimicrobium lacus TaxID=2715678 RepID=A0A6F8V6M2_9PROT|nr:hypothetical protein [Sulfurimicrobium lacus]BCB25304.1 hypothetical protein SKTS_01900 [Sulfurimicrobium lacus]